MLKLFMCVTLAVIFFCSNAFAELPNLGNMLKGGTTASPAASISDLLSTKAQIINKYLASTQELSTALEKAAVAFGVKSEVVSKLTAIKALTPKNISDSLLEKARQASQGALATIKAKMQGTPALSSGSANLLVGSLSSLLGASEKIKGLIPEVKKLVSGAGGALMNASGQDKTKIQDLLSLGLTISKSLPSDLKTVQGIISVLSQYATAQNISLPAGISGLLK